MGAVADRTCPSCGADVSTTSAFCSRCGADLAVDIVQVGVDPARRRSRARPPRPGARRAIVGAVLAGALVLAGVALLGGEDDGGAEPPRTTTTAEVATSTLPDGPEPGGPMLGEETGLSIAVSGQSNVQFDLDTGDAVFFELRLADVFGDRLVLAGDLGVQLFEARRLLDPDGPPPFTILDERATSDARAGESVIWAVDPSRRRLRALQVAPPAGVLAEVDLPVGHPVGVLGDDLVVSAPGGAFLVGLDGVARQLSTGSPVAVGGPLVAVVSCEGDLRCEIQALDATGAVVQSLPLHPEGTGGDLTAAAIADDGSMAWILGEPGNGSVVIDGRLAFPLPATAATTLAWSPGGRWLAGASDRDSLWFVDVTTGPEPRPVFVDLGRNVYPEQVRFVPG